MARVSLICGAQRSPRTATLNALMWEHWDHALFLLPTQACAARRVEQLILGGGRPGILGRRVLTFQDFVGGLLDAERRNARRVDEFDRRRLLEQAIRRLKSSETLAPLGEAAESNGFLSHLLRIITDLKQAAVEPENFRVQVAARRFPSALDTIIGEVYTAYQDLLRETNAYDMPGLYWEAHDLCRRGRPRGLESTRVLLLDGFDDFTPSEFRLLAALEPHLELLAFGLDCDPDQPSRRDLDALPLRTIERMRERFAVEVTTEAALSPTRFTEFAATHVFWRDRPPPATGLGPDIELAACPGAVAEVESIGRQVKSLLLDATPSNEIAVVFRDLSPVADLLRTVFAEFEIPVDVHHAAPLSESAVAAFVLNFLQAVETWQRDAVVDTLISPWFCPPEPSAPHHIDAIPLLARLARVVEGFGEWEQRTRRLLELIEKKTAPELDAWRQRLPDAAEAVRSLTRQVQRLRAVSDTLRPTATQGAYAQALDAALDALGVPAAVDRAPSPLIRERERAALTALRRVLSRIAAGDAEETEASRISRVEFVQLLRRVLRETPFRCAPAPGGVACLDLPTARYLRFDYVFLGGVNEGELPKTPSASAIYSDQDLEDLRQQGIELEARRSHGGRELRLLYHLLEAPRKRLYISWHTTARNGAAAGPSPYVSDLCELFPVEALPLAAPSASAFVPEPDQIASWRDLRNAAFVQDSTLRVGFREELADLEARAAAETTRHAHTPFDAYDGRLEDPANIARLAQRFNEAHLFSVNQIETYAQCPFRFFVERVLDIVDAPVPVAEFDNLVRGQILHAILEMFHRRFAGRSVPELPEAEARAALHEIIAQVFQDRAWHSPTAPDGVAVVEERRLRIQLERYLKLARENDGETAWKPRHFEVSFGRPDHVAAGSIDRPDPFCLDTDDGPVLFSGQIDRIDMDGDRARILDYKTAYTPRPKDIQRGLSIQLAVYAMALEAFLMPGGACEEACFIPVGKKRSVEGLGKGKGEWTERAERAKLTIRDSVRGIRAGRFTPTPPESACGACAARRVCRHETSRIELKQRIDHGTHA